MDLTSTVRTDTLPAVASVLVPGTAAAAPFAVLLLATSDPVRKFAIDHEATILVSALLVAVGTGFLIESLGSYVEYYILDRRHPDRDQMMDRWRLYLRVAWQREPTGQHYLRRMLAVFKFELNMFVASVFVVVGMLTLWGIGTTRSTTALTLSVVFTALGVYLLHAATETSLALAEIRELLLRGVGEPPFDASGEPSSTHADDRPTQSPKVV